MTHIQDHINFLAHSMLNLERLWDLAGFKPNVNWWKQMENEQGRFI